MFQDLIKADSMKKVIGIGETVWDVFPSGKRLGGAPVNFAFFAKEFGADVYPVSAIGIDELGDETLEALKGTGLNLDYIQRNDKPTSRVLVTMDSAGVPEYEIVEGVAWDFMSCDSKTLGLFSDADVICWGTLAQRSRTSHESVLKMIDSAPESCLRVYDINLRQHYYSREIIEASLERADVLKLNEDELPVIAELFSIPGSAAEQISALISRFSLKSVIFTQGAVCSEIYGPEGLLSHKETPKVNVVDTVGAGDSFTATYVMARMNGESVAAAHEKAVEVAAFVCTCSGAINPVPDSLKGQVVYGYDRATVVPGIVHFGVGNFHRAHLEYYTNLLLENPDQRSWGVSGAMIMPSDGPLFNALKCNRGEYNLTVCEPSGKNTVYRIGSLVELNWGEEDSEPIIARIAAPSTKIITLTITEGGYKVDIDRPHSVFWYVAEGLKRRMAAGLPVTILSCDNLQHNGATAERSFMEYFRAKYPEVAAWAESNVTFPNSMVDRITPATKSGDITDVHCEDFIQWVVEDKFIAGRPAWERVGVQFTDDVTPYENMKLSLLNASHSLLCYPAYLEGFRKVDAVLADSRYRSLIKTFMDVDVTPYVPAPAGVDLDEYKATLLRRFSNAAISDQVSRLCGDGIAKFEVYIVPNLSKMLRDGHDVSRLAFLIASYAKYLIFKRTESGQPIEVFEPHITSEDEALLSGCADASGVSDSFLDLSPFKALRLQDNPSFMTDYHRFCSMSVADGLAALHVR